MCECSLTTMLETCWGWDSCCWLGPKFFHHLHWHQNRALVTLTLLLFPMEAMSTRSKFKALELSQFGCMILPKVQVFARQPLFWFGLMFVSVVDSCWHRTTARNACRVPRETFWTGKRAPQTLDDHGPWSTVRLYCQQSCGYVCFPIFFGWALELVWWLKENPQFILV